MARLLCVILTFLLCATLADSKENEYFKVNAFVESAPPPTSSVFDWLPLKLFGLKKSTPILHLKVRAINRIVYTRKDQLLQEIENVDEYKKEQEQRFEQKPDASLEEKEVNVNEADKMYERGEEPKIFMLPKQGDTASRIKTDSANVKILDEAKDSVEHADPADDDFQIMYDDELKEYVLKRPMKIDENGLIDSWNGGDSKERNEGEGDDEVRKILENEGIDDKGNGSVQGKGKPLFTEVTLEEKDLDLEDLKHKSHVFKPGKSKIRTYDIAWMDPRFFEKEEFSVRLSPKQRSDWRDKLTNLSMLEERRADEHRDYGSSYILPVLKTVDYDNTSVPLAFNDIPVNVAVAFNFLYLANFDSEMMEFSMDVEMEFSWIDIR